MRHRRPAECRQVDALQCADADGGGAGGELSVLHHRAERRRGRGARSAARQAGRARQVGARSSRRGITFVDIAGLVRGASKGEGLGNQFLANIREVDAIVACGALLRGRRRHPCRRQDRSDRRHRDDRDRADAGRSRQPGEARRQRWRRRPRAAARSQGGQGDARSDQARARAAARRQAGAPASSASPRRRSCSTRSAC